jgi:hypothetical protein
LVPLIEAIAANENSIFEPRNFYEPTVISPDVIFTLGSKLAEEDALKILEPSQWTAWKETCAIRSGRRYAPNVVKNKPPETDTPGSWEPEEVEHAISDFFEIKTADQRKALLKEQLLKVEDFSRATKLAPETIQHLQTAARGLAEVSLNKWKDGREQNLRAFAANSPPQKLRQFLKAFSEEQYGISIDLAPAELRLMEVAVEKETSEDQRKAWKKQTELRSQFLASAITAAILEEVEQSVALTPEQLQKTGELAKGVILEYNDDIRRMFSYSGAGRWFLQGYTLFMPLAGIPEKEIKELWGAAKWDQWCSENPYMNNAVSYWENIEARHNQVKRK